MPQITLPNFPHTLSYTNDDGEIISLNFRGEYISLIRELGTNRDVLMFDAAEAAFLSAVLKEMALQIPFFLKARDAQEETTDG